MEERIKNLEERVKKLEEKVFVKKEFEKVDKIPFGTFAKQKNPQTYEERAITIGYYLWVSENRNFTYKDVEEFFQKVAWPTYSNPTMLIRRLKSKGWIEEVGDNSQDKIEYRILEDGIKIVENNFEEVAH